jgi:hypothetical protein
LHIGKLVEKDILLATTSPLDLRMNFLDHTSDAQNHVYGCEPRRTRWGISCVLPIVVVMKYIPIVQGQHCIERFKEA